MSNLGRLIDEACGKARGDNSWKVGFLLSALQEILDIGCSRDIELVAKEAIRRVEPESTKGGVKNA
jgi:hypothetical protein